MTGDPRPQWRTEKKRDIFSDEQRTKGEDNNLRIPLLGEPAPLRRGGRGG
jgi:hypothetical protein